MDDELAKMNANLENAEKEFNEDHHQKIEIDQNPDETNQEITKENGDIQEDDQVSLDPENPHHIDEAEPIETNSTKTDKNAKSNVIDNQNPSEHVEDHHSEHAEDHHSEKHDEEHHSEHNDEEHHSEKHEDTDAEHTSQENNDVDPSTELQEKAGDNLQEGEESIFKSKGKLEKDNGVIDESTDENAETTDESNDEKKTEEHDHDHKEEESREGSVTALKVIFSLLTLMIFA